MSKVVYFLSICAIILSACNGGKQKAVEEEFESLDSLEEVLDTLDLFDEDEEPPMTVDELFNDFFFIFTTDSRFQNQRVAFPLKCHEGDAEMMISREDWNQLSRFASHDVYSVIHEREQDMELFQDTAVNAVSVEWIYLQDDYVETYKFLRRDGKWMLTGLEKETVDNLPNNDFLRFYTRFSSDSTFQASSVNTPLPFVMTEDGGDEESPDRSLSLEEWFEMSDELPIPSDVLVNIDYGQACLSQNRKILLMESAGSGLYIKYKFMKEKNGWKLTEIEN